MSAEEPDRRPLRPLQAFVLLELLRHGTCAFVGGKGSREGWRAGTGQFGRFIKAYGSPEHFLEARGLIEKAESNAPGWWGRLTPHGRVRAERLAKRRGIARVVP